MTPGDVGTSDKGVADVGSALLRAEVALTGGAPPPRQPARLHVAIQARGQALGDQPRLIEPAFPFTGLAERNGDQRVHVGGQVSAALLEHQIAQRTGKRASLLELEGMERVTERALVPCRRPRVVPYRQLGPARPAEPGRASGVRREGRERHAARGTVRRGGFGQRGAPPPPPGEAPPPPPPP